MNAQGGALLAIEVSNPSMSTGDEGSVAIVRPVTGTTSKVTLERLRPGSRHDDALMRAVDSACAASGIAPRDIARIAVSAGPGGYTGLRIAMTSAKMLATTIGAELLAVPTTRVVAFGFHEDEPERAREAFIVALASKRDTAWCQPFLGTDEVAEGELCDEARLEAVIRSTEARAMLADAHLPEGMRAAAERAGVKVLPPRLDAVLCARASEGLPTVGVDALAPIYPREPEAVRKWREGE